MSTPQKPLQLAQARQTAGSLATPLAIGGSLALALWLVEPETPWQLLLLVVGVALAVALCWPKGQRALRRAKSQGRDWTDQSTGLMSEQGLGEFGEDIFEEARKSRKPLSLLVFYFQDLSEVQTLYGEATRRALLEKIGSKLRHAAGHSGLALRTGKSTFAILLPKTSRDAALQLATAKLGTHCIVEMESQKNDEIVLIPRMAVACTSPDSSSLAQMYDRCLSDIGARAALEHAKPPGATEAPASPYTRASLLAYEDTVIPVYDRLPSTMPAPLPGPSAPHRNFA